MKIVVDERNEWWLCDVDRCRNEIEFGGNRPTGIAVTVCRNHYQPGDVSIRNEGIPLDEGVSLHWDETLAGWHIEKWDSGGLTLTDETFATGLVEVFKNRIPGIFFCAFARN